MTNLEFQAMQDRELAQYVRQVVSSTNNPFVACDLLLTKIAEQQRQTNTNNRAQEEK